MQLEELVGQELAGRFLLNRIIGTGGFGAVFEAEQLSVGRRCAVKVLLPSHLTDERTILRFRAEARVLSQLVHPNTVVLYDFGQIEALGLFFLAMEYLEGENLNQVIRARGALELGDVLHVTSQIAHSLHEAHEKGLVHRDIKPHNVMLIERGADRRFVKVIDFGIAKAPPSVSNDLTATGTMLGTPQYMAPEQIFGEPLDGRTDQYALAICVYKMLTGETPFAGGSTFDIAHRQVNDTPPTIRSLRPDLGIEPAFDDVLLRALAKTPAERFESILDFAGALERAAGQSAAAERAGGLPPQLARPAPQTARTAHVVEVPTQSMRAAFVDDDAARGRLAAAEASQGAALAVSNESSRESSNESSGESSASDEEPGWTRAISTEISSSTAALRTNKASEEVTSILAYESPPRPRPSRHVVVLMAMVAVVFVALGVTTLVRSTVAPANASATAEGSRTAGEPSAPPVAAEAGGEVPAGQAAPQRPADAAAEAPAAARHEALRVAVTAAATTEVAAPQPVASQPVASQPAAPQPAGEARERRGEGAAGEASGRVVAPRPDAPAPTVRTEQAPAPDGPSPDVASTPPAATSRVRVQVTLIPWGTLYINRRAYADTPRQVVHLPPGRHTFVLMQQDVEKARKTVDVKPGSTTMVELVASTH